jgi:hypothetical protein
VSEGRVILKKGVYIYIEREREKEKEGKREER